MSYEQAQPEERRALIASGIEHQQQEIGQYHQAGDGLSEQDLALMAAQSHLEEAASSGEEQATDLREALELARRAAAKTKVSGDFIIRVTSNLGTAHWLQEQQADQLTQAQANGKVIQETDEQIREQLKTAASEASLATDCYVAAVGTDNEPTPTAHMHQRESEQLASEATSYTVDELQASLKYIAKLREGQPAEKKKQDALVKEINYLYTTLNAKLRELVLSIRAEQNNAASIGRQAVRAQGEIEEIAQERSGLSDEVDLTVRGAHEVIQAAEQAQREIG